MCSFLIARNCLNKIFGRASYFKWHAFCLPMIYLNCWINCLPRIAHSGCVLLVGEMLKQLQEHDGNLYRHTLVSTKMVLKDFSALCFLPKARVGHGELAHPGSPLILLALWLKALIRRPSTKPQAWRDHISVQARGKSSEPEALGPQIILRVTLCRRVKVFLLALYHSTTSSWISRNPGIAI